MYIFLKIFKTDSYDIVRLVMGVRAYELAGPRHMALHYANTNTKCYSS